MIKVHRRQLHYHYMTCTLHDEHEHKGQFWMSKTIYKMYKE